MTATHPQPAWNPESQTASARPRPATQQDVAAAAGVSRGLVSLALKGEGRMSPHTRQRILDTARQLHYRPNAAASELASRRSRRLAVVVPYLDNPYFDALLRSMRAYARQAGYVVAAFVSDLVDQVERTTIEDVLSLRPEGLVLPGTGLSQEELVELSTQIPLVVLDRALPSLDHRPDCALSLVRMDEALAASLITSHLSSQGVGHMLFLSPVRRLYEPLVTERRAACRSHARRAGMTFTSTRCEGATATVLRRHLVDQGPTGVVVYNDILAIEVHAALLSLGLRPGSDVALVSYDNTSLAARPDISLTSVDQSLTRLAHEAVDALLARGTRERVRTVPPSLTVRASSRLR